MTNPFAIKRLIFKKIELKDKGSYDVFNRSSQYLGVLWYYDTWKKYVFSSNIDVFLDDSCLDEVLSFLRGLNNE